GALSADPAGLVAGAAGAGAAVQGGPLVVETLDVLHDVDLADAGPVPVVAPVRRAEHPEGRPVSLGSRTRDVGHLQPGLDPQFAARRGLEVGAVGLDPAGGPLPGGVADRGDPQVAGAVEGDVRRARGHRLDLAGAEPGRAAGVAVAGGVAPVGGVDARTG